MNAWHDRKQVKKNKISDLGLTFSLFPDLFLEVRLIESLRVNGV